MNMKTTVAVLAAVFAAGCTTDKVHELMRADPAPLTEFLPHNERLVRRADTFLVHYTWLNTNAVIAADFKNVYISPFDLTYLRKGKGYDTLRDKLIDLDGAIKDLGEYGREAFIKAFKEHEQDTKLKVVNDPTLPHTMILEFAITAFVPTRAALETVGFVGSFFCPGVGLVADCLSSGSLAVECRVRDSGTKEIVGMFADTEGEPHALLQFSKFTYTSAAKINLKRMAENLAVACATTVDDRAKLRRSFPFSFIALPWESKLND